MRKGREGTALEFASRWAEEGWSERGGGEL